MTDTKGLLTAMLAVQAEAPTLKKSATNPHFKSKYAPLDTIVETIGPILHKHQLVWSTLPGTDEHGHPALTYRLSYAPTGEVLEGTMPLLLSKQDAQGQGSAITYARRYALCAVLNLVADDDDDGARAAAGQAKRAYGSSPPATVAQKKRLRADITRNSLTADVMSELLKGAGVTLGAGEKINEAIERLTGAQVSVLIDTIAQGAVPTGASDVPAAAPDEFKHEPAPAAGPGQYDVLGSA